MVRADGTEYAARMYGNCARYIPSLIFGIVMALGQLYFCPRKPSPRGMGIEVRNSKP